MPHEIMSNTSIGTSAVNNLDSLFIIFRFIMNSDKVARVFEREASSPNYRTSTVPNMKCFLISAFSMPYLWQKYISKSGFIKQLVLMETVSYLWWEDKYLRIRTAAKWELTLHCNFLRINCADLNMRPCLALFVTALNCCFSLTYQ